MVTLKFSGVDSTTRTVPPARSTSHASSVAARARRRRRSSARSSASRAERLRRLDRPQRERSSVAVTRRSSPASLTVSVIGAAAIAASASRARRARRAKMLRASRAGAPRRGRRPARRRAPAAQRASHGRRARRARRRRRAQPGGADSPGGSATTISSIARRAQRLDAPLEHRAAGQNDERLGPVGAKAFATAAATRRATATFRVRRTAWPPASPRRSAGGGRRGAPRPRSSPISSAYISSDARIFFARVNICFSPVERPLSCSRIARLRTTSASS